MVSFIPTLTIVPLIAGYVYCRTYYGAFGIYVPFFFSFSDYMFASIEIYFLIGVSCFCAFLIYLVGLEKKWRKRKMVGLIIYFLIVPFGLFLLSEDKTWSFNYPNSNLDYGMPFLVIVSLVALILFRDQLQIFNFKSFIIIAIVLVVPMLLGVFYFRAKADSASILKTDQSIVSHSGTNNQNIITEGSYLVGANARYLFIYDKANGATSIKPVASVKEIQITHQKDSNHERKGGFFHIWFTREGKAPAGTASDKTTAKEAV